VACPSDRFAFHRDRGRKYTTTAFVARSGEPWAGRVARDALHQNRAASRPCEPWVRYPAAVWLGQTAIASASGRGATTGGRVRRVRRRSTCRRG